MKTRVTIELSEADRYLIATYFRESTVSTFVGGRRGGKTMLAKKIRNDRNRRRATRAQARLYIKGAVRLCLRERIEALKGRTKTIATKLEAKALADPITRDRPAALAAPSERNRSLFA